MGSSIFLTEGAAPWSTGGWGRAQLLTGCSWTIQGLCSIPNSLSKRASRKTFLKITFKQHFYSPHTLNYFQLFVSNSLVIPGQLRVFMHFRHCSMVTALWQPQVLTPHTFPAARQIRLASTLTTSIPLQHPSSKCILNTPLLWITLPPMPTYSLEFTSRVFHLSPCYLLDHTMGSITVLRSDFSPTLYNKTSLLQIFIFYHLPTSGIPWQHCLR